MFKAKPTTYQDRLLALALSGFPRLTFHSFLELSDKERKLYLAQYPKSRHARHLHADIEDDEFEDDDGEDDGDDNDLLPKSQINRGKRDESKVHNDNGSGDQHTATDEVDFDEEGSETKDGISESDQEDYDIKSIEYEKRKVENERYNRRQANSITEDSVESIMELTDSSLKKVSFNATKNKNEIMSKTKKLFKDMPSILSDGISGIRNIMEGRNINSHHENPENPYDEPDRLDAHGDKTGSDKKQWVKPLTRQNVLRVMTVVAKATLLSGGVLLAASAAGPLGLILAKTLVESWGDADQVKSLFDREEEKKKSKINVFKDEDDEDEEDEETGSIKNIRNVSTSSVIEYEGVADEDTETLSFVTDMVREHIYHSDIGDIKKITKKVFAGHLSTNFESTSSSLKYTRLLSGIRRLFYTYNSTLPPQEMTNSLFGIYSGNENMAKHLSDYLSTVGFKEVDYSENRKQLFSQYKKGSVGITFFMKRNQGLFYVTLVDTSENLKEMKTMYSDIF